MTDGSPTPAFEEFLDLWESLLTESAKRGTVILVEGGRDRASLRALGVRGPIVLVHRGVRLGTLAQELANQSDRAIVLTDWDGTGGSLAQRLREFLASGPVVVDLEFRRRLARVLRGELVHVEGLHGWARRNAERAGAPLDHFLPSASDGETPVRG